MQKAIESNIRGIGPSSPVMNFLIESSQSYTDQLSCFFDSGVNLPSENASQAVGGETVAAR
jgi:hypothetical protein